MSCKPNCPYFSPVNEQQPIEFVYDKQFDYIKRRAEPKVYKCRYDGQVITTWDKECPRDEDEDYDTEEN